MGDKLGNHLLVKRVDGSTVQPDGRSPRTSRRKSNDHVSDNASLPQEDNVRGDYLGITRNLAPAWASLSPIMISAGLTASLLIGNSPAMAIQYYMHYLPVTSSIKLLPGRMSHSTQADPGITLQDIRGSPPCLLSF